MTRPGEGEILRIHLPFIERFFAIRVENAEDAEDLAQEAAEQVIRSWVRFEHRSAVSTWIYAVCRNVLWAYARGRERSRVVHGLAEDPPADDSTEQRRLDIAMALSALDADERRLYDLRFRQGYSVREVAEELGRPEGTIKYELHLLRKRARRLLE